MSKDIIQFRFSNSRIEKIEHPEKGQVIVLCPCKDNKPDIICVSIHGSYLRAMFRAMSHSKAPCLSAITFVVFIIFNRSAFAFRRLDRLLNGLPQPGDGLFH